MIAKRKRVAKQAHWRVYGVKHPMDFEGQPFRPQGKAKWRDGWFWIKCGDEILLRVRVHGLEVARALCRQLNLGASTEPKKRRK